MYHSPYPSLISLAFVSVFASFYLCIKKKTGVGNIFFLEGPHGHLDNMDTTACLAVHINWVPLYKGMYFIRGH